MSFKVLTIEHKKEWNDFLEKLPIAQQDIYFTPEYYSLFENMGNGKAHCFVYQNEHNDLAIYPFLLNSVNQLGYELEEDFFDIQGAYGYNGVAYSTLSENFIISFYECFDQYCLDNKIIAEFTRFNPMLDNFRFSEKFMTCLFDRETVSVDLTKDYESIKREYQRSTRKQISRMKRNPDIELEYHTECTPSLIEEVYAIYLESMDRLNAKGELYFTQSFFKEMLTMKNTGTIIFKLKGQSASFISFLHFKNKVHGFLGGTLDDHLTLSPFSLLYDYMILYGIAQKAEFLHVGGGATNDKEDNLLKYKLHFSKQTNDFYIGKKIHNQKIYEQVITQWEKKLANSNELKSNQLLKYRNIDSQ